MLPHPSPACSAWPSPPCWRSLGLVESARPRRRLRGRRSLAGSTCARSARVDATIKQAMKDSLAVAPVACSADLHAGDHGSGAGHHRGRPRGLEDLPGGVRRLQPPQRAGDRLERAAPRAHALRTASSSSRPPRSSRRAPAGSAAASPCGTPRDSTTCPRRCPRRPSRPAKTVARCATRSSLVTCAERLTPTAPPSRSSCGPRAPTRPSRRSWTPRAQRSASRRSAAPAATSAGAHTSTKVVLVCLKKTRR